MVMIPEIAITNAIAVRDMGEFPLMRVKVVKPSGQVSFQAALTFSRSRYATPARWPSASALSRIRALKTCSLRFGVHAEKNLVMVIDR
jgi:hypothetical protein